MASEKTGARVTVGVTLFVALAILLASQSADATTIVILKTQSEIIAAADSMVKSIGQENPAVATFCKIMPVHDFFIAAAGIYQFGSGRLNIQRVVASATQKSEPLSQAVEHSIRRIPTALFNAVSDAREKQALYDELMRGNVLTFFFGFESGKPSVYTSRLRIMDDQPARAGKPNFQSSTLERDDCGPDCVSSDGMSLIFRTSSSAIDDFLAHNSDFLSKENPLQIVRKLIALDIEANKDRSGPPVNILRIDANGPKWIENELRCPPL